MEATHLSQQSWPKNFCQRLGCFCGAGACQGVYCVNIRSARAEAKRRARGCAACVQHVQRQSDARRGCKRSVHLRGHRECPACDDSNSRRVQLLARVVDMYRRL